MRNLTLALALVLVASLLARADGAAGNAPGSAQEAIPTLKIEKALRSYADAVGCNFRFDKNNVVQFDPSGQGYLTYVAVFFLDAGCSGGSNMGTSMFAMLDWGGFGMHDIFVAAAVSQPAAQSFGFPQFIDRIFVKGNALWYSGRVHDWSKETSNSPSVPVEGQILLRQGAVDVAKDQKFGASYWMSAPWH